MKRVSPFAATGIVHLSPRPAGSRETITANFSGLAANATYELALTRGTCRAMGDVHSFFDLGAELALTAGSRGSIAVNKAMDLTRPNAQGIARTAILGGRATTRRWPAGRSCRSSAPAEPDVCGGARPARLLGVPRTALLVIDMLNPYDHEDADPLAESVEEKLPTIVALRDRAREDDEMLLVYVNDNYDQWEADRDELVERAIAGRRPELVEPIAPREPVPFIRKGRHSIFYETAVDHLLRVNGVERLVLTGQVTEQCILYSALDAYIRGYEIAVPPDAVAHIDRDLATAALKMMESNMHASLDGAPEALRG